MKTIKCNLNDRDYVCIRKDNTDVELRVWEDGEVNTVVLNPAKIRELRKQLKKALIQIEGEQESEA